MQVLLVLHPAGQIQLQPHAQGGWIKGKREKARQKQAPLDALACIRVYMQGSTGQVTTHMR